MNKIKFWLGAASVALFALFVPMGCDNSGSGDNGELDAYFKNHPFLSDPRAGGASIVHLIPASATLSTVGERAVFQFSGGTAPYTWDVADPSKGSVAGNGEQGIYTVTVVGDNNVIAYDSAGHAAIATISGSGGGVVAPLSVTASPSELDVNGWLAILTAAGGTGPYTWSVLFPTSRGDLPNGNTGVSVVYRRTASGDNAVTVTDSLGATANVVIKQP